MYFDEEYYANLKAIEEAFPHYRLLNKGQMMDFLGLTRVSSLDRLGLTTKLTRESFAMRLSKMGRKEEDDV